MRSRFVFRDGAMIAAHLAPRQPSKRSDLPCPAIRSDGMDVTRNPANGLLYDSRSAYERGVRDAGCVIVGNDVPELAPRPIETPGGLERDIKDAIDQLSG